ncbi:AbfB domain-containing protein [Streptomyces olivaceoviridis]
MSPLTSSSSSLDKNDATWIVRRGLADGSCVSRTPGRPRPSRPAGRPG